MNTEHATGIMTILKSVEPKKEWVNSAIEDILLSIEDGDLNALQIVAKIKVLTEALDEIRNSIMQTALSELRKFGGKQLALYGVLLSEKEAGVRWDFKVCNDVGWNDLQYKIDILKSDQKNREAVLKQFASNPFQTEFICEESGEVIEIDSAPVRGSTNIVMVEYPKEPKPKKGK